MKASLRTFRITIAILALVLCLLIAILWIRSYFISDYLLVYQTSNLADSTSEPTLSIATGVGGIAWGRTRWTGPAEMELGVRVKSSQYTSDEPHYPATWRSQPTLGFHLERLNGANGSRSFSTFIIIAPFWFLFLIFLLPALPWLIHLRRLLRRKPGHCPHCGYDLRASPTKCPECGRARTPTPAVT